MQKKVKYFNSFLDIYIKRGYILEMRHLFVLHFIAEK